MEGVEGEGRRGREGVKGEVREGRRRRERDLKGGVN